jgi:hypothetical protein
VFQHLNQVNPLEGNYPKFHQQGVKDGILVLARCGHNDFHPGDNETQYDVYPPIELEADDELPERVKRSFQEALDTFANGFWNPSAQAIGRALTDAMMELKPEDTKPENWAEKGLKRQIKILIQQNILPPVIGDWAEEVRVVRVLSEHGDEGKDWWANEPEAAEAMEFAKWVFRYTFVLPEQINKRRERLQEEIASQSKTDSTEQ